MKQTKLLLLCAVLLTGGATLRAQITPEALIGQCPDLPSASTLVAYSTDDENTAAQQAIQTFRDQIAALKERAKKESNRVSDIAGTAARSDAERLTQQMTGKSVTEVQNMSKADTEAMGMQMVQKQLKSAGLGNMSLADLQALEGKSEDEIVAAMSGGGVTMGGLRPDELKALEGMNEQQAAAYMQQGDRMQRMQQSYDPSALKKSQEAGRKAAANQQIGNDMKQINDRWAEIDRLMEKETAEVGAQLEQIGEKYLPELHALAARYGDGKVDATPAEIEAASARMKVLRVAMKTEQAPVWRNHIAKMQSRIKSKLADGPRMDDLYAQSLGISGMNELAKVGMQPYSYSIAGDYLDMARQVTNF
jgi:hypothetical protein